MYKSIKSCSLDRGSWPFHPPPPPPQSETFGQIPRYVGSLHGETPRGLGLWSVKVPILFGFKNKSLLTKTTDKTPYREPKSTSSQAKTFFFWDATLIHNFTFRHRRRLSINKIPIIPPSPAIFCSPKFLETRDQTQPGSLFSPSGAGREKDPGSEVDKSPPSHPRGIETLQIAPKWAGCESHLSTNTNFIILAACPIGRQPNWANQSRKNKLPYKLSFILQNYNIAHEFSCISTSTQSILFSQGNNNINFLRVDVVFI